MVVLSAYNQDHALHSDPPNAYLRGNFSSTGRETSRELELIGSHRPSAASIDAAAAALSPLVP